MMQVTEKTGASGQKLFELSGVIDETVDFEKIKAEGAKQLHVDLYGIKRINSIGIKKWMLYFSELQKNNVQIFFYRISPPIVEQMVNISNFKCGAEVVSVVLPFQCKSCGKQNYFVKMKQELSGVNLDSVPWPCQHCAKTGLEFDDLSDEYLKFWN